jgi:hypothetical protein
MEEKSRQGQYEVGGIRPGISRREGHMEPAERRAAYEAEQAKKKEGK